MRSAKRLYVWGFDGRSWDRTTTKPNPPAATEADYSGDLQEERGSTEDDDVPLEPLLSTVRLDSRWTRGTRTMRPSGSA